MGVTVKTLSRLIDLHGRGLLRPPFSVLELGAQELYCQGEEGYLLKFIDHFSQTIPTIKKTQIYTESEISHLANNGLMGNLIRACGQAYCALDIFESEHTILFDLNIHNPGEDLLQKFDLVTNFGTTEHIINQYHAMKTIHDLVKPGGLIYHDLPLSGYHTHGYFSYNPLFFYQLAAANNYNLIFECYTRSGTPTPTPEFMQAHGFPDAGYYDSGIEFILQKTSSDPFRMPLETSTNLDLSPEVWGNDNPYISVKGHPSTGINSSISGTKPPMAEVIDSSGPRPLSLIRYPWLVQVSGRDLLRELIRRSWGKLLNWVPFK